MDKLYWYETDQMCCRPPTPEQLVDVDDADLVLDFTYRYLEAHALPPSDDEVHNVIAAIARYKGPPIIRRTTLELFLAGILTVAPA